MNLCETCHYYRPKWKECENPLFVEEGECPENGRMVIEYEDGRKIVGRWA